MKGEFVKRGKESKKPSKRGRENDGEEGVPDEKIEDAGFGWLSFFPSDSRMKNVGENGGDGS